MKTILSAAAIALLLGTPAFAQGTAAKAPVERSAKSKDCSAQADVKSLHGKARKRFRSACMRGKAT